MKSISEKSKNTIMRLLAAYADNLGCPTTPRQSNDLRQCKLMIKYLKNIQK